jgi:hypothetical protein
MQSWELLRVAGHKRIAFPLPKEVVVRQKLYWKQEHRWYQVSLGLRNHIVSDVDPDRVRRTHEQHLGQPEPD